MEIVKRHFPAILDDNTEAYFRHMEAIITSIDIHASMEITNRITGITVRVAPSSPQFFPLLQKDIERIHNALQLRMNYSKSMKSSGTINFNIEIPK